MSRAQNLVTHSEALDDASWTKTNGTIAATSGSTAPDGTLTAGRFTDTVDGAPAVHAVSQALAPTDAKGHFFTFVIYLKDASGGATPWVAVSCDSGASAAFVNLVDGTSTGPGGNMFDVQVEESVNGWWRIWVAARIPTDFASFSPTVYTAPNSSTVFYTGGGTARFYVWGAQVVRSSTAQDYVKTTTPALDDGAWLRPRQLEKQNLLTWSEAMANAAWLKNTGVTLTDATTDVTDPAAGNTASKLAYAGGLPASSFLLAQTAPIASTRLGQLGGIGFWARTLSGSATLQITENWSGSLTTITVTSAWTFFPRIAGALGAGVALQFAIYLSSGSGAALTVYLWHPQMMADSNQLGPYIRTKGSTHGAYARRLRPIGIGEPQNLLNYSEQLDNAYWNNVALTTTANAIANPVDGAVTADQLVEDNTTNVHTNAPGGTNPGEGTVMTLSAFLKDNNRQFAGLRLSTFVGSEATFDLTNGVVTNLFNVIQAGIAPVGATGWWRCWITLRVADQHALQMQVFLGSTGGAYSSYAGSTSKSIYAWGVQLNVGGLIPYVAVTVPAIGQSYASRQLGPYPQNLSLFSEQFDQAAGWTPVGATIAANAFANPINGAVDADAIVDAAAPGSHNVFTPGGAAVTCPEGTPFCYSVYVKLAKPGSVPVVLLSGFGALGGGGTYFNLVTNARVDVLFPNTFSRCEDLGGGWFRCSVFGRSRGGGSQMSIGFYLDTSGTTYTGTGTAVAYLWGAQTTFTKEPVPYVKVGAAVVGSPPLALSPPLQAQRHEALFEQNGLLFSEAFDSWGIGNGTVTANAVAGPFGGTTADKFTDTVDGGPTQHLLFLNHAGPESIADGRVVTFSVYVKPIAGAPNMILFGPNGTNTFVTFDLITGTVNATAVNAGYSLFGYGISRVGTGGWYRIWLSVVQVSSVQTVYLWACGSAGATSYTGTGTDRYYLWGAQLTSSNGLLPYVASGAGYLTAHADARPVRGPA